MATKARTRKPKAVAPAAPANLEEAPAIVAPQALQPVREANLSPTEGKISAYAGIFLIVAALIPRTFRQWVLLAMGAAFLHRGQTRHCEVYSALGIDTNKDGSDGQ